MKTGSVSDSVPRRGSIVPSATPSFARPPGPIGGRLVVDAWRLDIARCWTGACPLLGTFRVYVAIGNHWKQTFPSPLTQESKGYNTSGKRETLAAYSFAYGNKLYESRALPAAWFHNNIALNDLGALHPGLDNKQARIVHPGGMHELILQHQRPAHVDNRGHPLAGVKEGILVINERNGHSIQTVTFPGLKFGRALTNSRSRQMVIVEDLSYRIDPGNPNNKRVVIFRTFAFTPESGFKELYTDALVTPFETAPSLKIQPYGAHLAPLAVNPLLNKAITSSVEVTDLKSLVDPVWRLWRCSLERTTDAEISRYVEGVMRVRFHRGRGGSLDRIRDCFVLGGEREKIRGALDAHGPESANGRGLEVSAMEKRWETRFTDDGRVILQNEQSYCFAG